MTEDSPAVTDAPSPIMQRIQARLDALGLSERKASLDAVGNASVIRNIRTGATKDPGVKTFQALAPVLKTTPEWLAYGVDVANGNTPVEAARGAGPASLYLPVTGEVAAGTWLEVDQLIDHPVFDPIPVPADPRWPRADQYALITRGTSIDRIARDGDVLCCVDTRGRAYRPSDDHLVIVERSRDGGGLIERTAKKYRRNGDLHEFWPDSDDPRWTKPIVLDPREPSESVVVEVVARVIFVYRGVAQESGPQPI